MNKTQVLDFSQCTVRLFKVVIKRDGEIIPLDILDFGMPGYYLYINDKTISHLFEEYKYSYHAFRLFSN